MLSLVFVAESMCLADMYPKRERSTQQPYYS